MIWATVSSWPSFCCLYRASPSLATKKYNQSDFGIDHLVKSTCRVFSCVVGKGCHAKSWLIGKDWCWEGLGAGGEGDNRGWDGWMASLTQWMWVWVNSGRWWWTGRPGVLWFTGSQRVGHDWATELNYWTELLNWIYMFSGILLSHKEHGNPTICDNMDRLWRCYDKWNKSGKEEKIFMISIICVV